MRMAPTVAVVMGSQSDWSTLQAATLMLTSLQIPFHAEIISAHRTPDKLVTFAEQAAAAGFQVIIAGAGGAAHLPGMLASKTLLPVLGIPVFSDTLNGIDSLYSIVQMPKGIPVGTLAIGPTGAANAALLAAQILALNDLPLRARLTKWRQDQTAEVLAHSDPQGVA